jgi:hypothetical protein
MKARLVLLTLVLAVLCVVPAAAAPKNPGAVQPIFGDGLEISVGPDILYTAAQVKAYGSGERPFASLMLRAETVNGKGARISLYADDITENPEQDGYGTINAYAPRGFYIVGPLKVTLDPYQPGVDVLGLIESLEARIAALEASRDCQ